MTTYQQLRRPCTGQRLKRQAADNAAVEAASPQARRVLGPPQYTAQCKHLLREVGNPGPPLPRIPVALSNGMGARPLARRARTQQPPLPRRTPLPDKVATRFSTDETSENHASEVGPSRTDTQTDLTITVYASARRQWGGLSMTITLYDKSGQKANGAWTVLGSWPLVNTETKSTAKVRVPLSFKAVGAAVIEPGWKLVGSKTRSIYLDRLEIQDPCDVSPTIIWAHSWVGGETDRIFFSNQACLPQNAGGLRELRERELRYLRGEGPGQQKDAERHDPERIYDYDVYNDLSAAGFDGSASSDKLRDTLGYTEHEKKYPYPRRLRTGRPKVNGSQQEIPAGTVKKVYMPLDERFDDRKYVGFQSGAIAGLLPSFLSNFLDTIFPSRVLREFSGLDDVSFIYRNTWSALLGWVLLVPGLGKLVNLIALPPLPLVASGRNTTWDDDAEFGRQLIAGTHPCELRAVVKQDGVAAVPDHVQKLLSELQLEDHLNDTEPEYFYIDYATTLLGKLNKDKEESILDLINKETLLLGKIKVFQYAPIVLLKCSKGERLRPAAVKLFWRERPGGKVTSRVLTPNDHPLHWRLAKSHFLVADAGYHQLISHWLRTHACIEPFIIATQRRLSVAHPLWKLMRPHFKYTMNINSNARQTLINGEGVVEQTFNTGHNSLQVCSAVYAGWRFDKQALPADLLNRGMLVEDSGTSPANGAPTGGSNLRTSVTWKGQKYSIALNGDYPYAADGMLLWDALHTWFKEYLGNYYGSKEDLAKDHELQNWWAEIREKGHGDIKDGWQKLEDLEDLADIATTIAWLASGHHSAVNFGQYSYQGYFPNYPTISRKSIDDVLADDMEHNPDEAFLKTFSTKRIALQVMGVMRVLSSHDAEEEYIGYRSDEATWTNKPQDKEAWARFQHSVDGITKAIKERNAAKDQLRHRYMQYELLMPHIKDFDKPLVYKGPPPCGVPNSTSI